METPVEKKTETIASQETAAPAAAAPEELSDEDVQQMMLTQIDGIKVILQNKLIVLSPLRFEDYPLTRVLEHADMRAFTEYQSIIMAKLINSIIARSKLTQEEMGILRGNSSQDLLRTYHTIGAAVERALVEILIG